MAKKKTLLCILIAVLICFLMASIPFIMPIKNVDASTPITVKIGTWNVSGGNGTTYGDVIKNANLDIVGIQNTKESEVENLKTASGMTYSHYFTAPNKTYDRGLVILSNYEISETGIYTYNPTGGREQRILARAVIKIDETTSLNFFITHLTLKQAETETDYQTELNARNSQFGQISRQVNQYDNFVVAGSFSLNWTETEAESLYAQIENSKQVIAVDSVIPTNKVGTSNENLVYSSSNWTFTAPTTTPNGTQTHYLLTSTGTYTKTESYKVSVENDNERGTVSGIVDAFYPHNKTLSVTVTAKEGEKISAIKWGTENIELGTDKTTATFNIQVDDNKSLCVYYQSIKFGTYNISGGSALGYDFAKYGAEISAKGLDIVGIQAVGHNSTSYGNVDCMAILSQSSGLPYYRFYKALNRGGGGYGLGVLSRYPLTEFTDEQCITKLLSSTTTSTDEQRILARAEIDVNGTKINFFVTHLSTKGTEIASDGSGKTLREVQFEQINAVVNAQEGGVPKYSNFVIAGSFNMTIDDQMASTCYGILENSNTIITIDNQVVTNNAGTSNSNLVFSSANWTYGNATGTWNNSNVHYLVGARAEFGTAKYTVTVNNDDLRSTITGITSGIYDYGTKMDNVRVVAKSGYEIQGITYGNQKISIGNNKTDVTFSIEVVGNQSLTVYYSKINFGSYNIKVGQIAGFDFTKIAKELTDRSLDVIGFQEVDYFNGNSNRFNGDSMLELSKATGYPYFSFYRAENWGGGWYGLGILSRYPIVETETYKLAYAETQATSLETRVLGRAKIDYCGTYINFFTTHLDFKETPIEYDGKTIAVADKQMMEINDIVKHYDNFVISGDFNTTIRTPKDTDAVSVLDESIRYNIIENSDTIFDLSNYSLYGGAYHSTLGEWICIDNIIYSIDDWTFETPSILEKLSGSQTVGQGDATFSDHKLVYVTASYNPSGIVSLSNDSTKGTVSGLVSGLQEVGSTQNVTITPAKGYKITSVTWGGQSVSITNEQGFTTVLTVKAGNIQLVVSYAKETFEVSTNGNVNGTVSGLNVGTQEYGTQYNVTITPNKGYYISEVMWGGQALTVTDNKQFSATLTLSDMDSQLSVVYTKEQYTVTITNNDLEGSVTGITGGLQDYGSQFNVTISAKDGYRINSVWWDGKLFNITDDKTLSLNLTLEDKNTELSIEYVKETYVVTLTNDDQKGVVLGIPSGTKLEYGTSLTINVSAKEGYLIQSIKWNSLDVEVSNSKNMTLIKTVEGQSLLEVTYSLAPLPQYSITVTSDSEKGSVLGLTSPTYQQGSNVTIVVVSKTGYLIDSIKWNGQDVEITHQTQLEFSKAVECDVNLVVEFKEVPPQEFDLTISNDSTKGQILGDGSNKYLDGTTVTIYVIAKDGYLIDSVKWNGQNVEIVDENQITVEKIIEGNSTLEIAYKSVPQGTFDLTINNDQTKGQIIGLVNGTYTDGTTVDVRVVAQDGYDISFIKYGENVITVTDAKDMTFSLTIDGNKNLEVSYSQTISNNDGDNQSNNLPLILALAGVSAGFVACFIVMIVMIVKNKKLKKKSDDI